MPGWIDAGGPSRGAWAHYNETRAFAFWPTLESISISQLHPDGIMAMSCRIVDKTASITFEDDDEVTITFDGSKIWAGHARTTGKRQVSEPGPRVYDLTGQDFTAKLDDSTIGTKVERPREYVAKRVAWILTKLVNFSITAAGVSLPSEKVEPASYEGMTVREALQRVADELRLHFYVDFDKDLHMFRTETVAGPFSLDDTSPDYASSFPYSDFDYSSDTIELTNAVKVKGARHTRIVTDADSIAAYGRQASIIIDDSLTTVAQVVAAGQRRLFQLAEPIVEGSLVCWEPGLQAGMLVPVKNDLWGIDESFLITEVEITAVDPHDDSGEAMLRSAIRFTDRRRVGRFPGSGKNKKDANRKAVRDGATAQSRLGSCCTPVPIDESPLTQYGGGGTGPTDKGKSISVSHVYSGGDTTASIAIPDGADVIGRYLVAYVAADDGTNITTEMEAAGWTKMLPAVNTPWWWIHVDGTEGFTGSGDTIDVEFSGMSLTLVSVVELLAGVYDEGPTNPGPWFVGAVGSTADPEAISDPGWGGEYMRVFTVVVTDGTVVTAGPSGFTEVDTDDSQGGILLRMDAVNMAEGAVDPSAYSTSGVSQSYTLILRGGGTAFGIITPGPTWDGDNVFERVSSATEPDWEVVGDDLEVTSNAAGNVLDYRAVGPPDMPTQLEDWTITVPFVLETAGSLTDPYERSLQVFVTLDGSRIVFAAQFGDSFWGQGVSLDDSEFVAVDITEGDLMYLKLAYDGETAHAKLWDAADDEPAWQVSLARDQWPDAYFADDGMEIVVNVGNSSGPDQVVTISPFVIGGGAQAGESVDWHVLGYGDGTTTVFTTPYAFEDNTLEARVDKQAVVPSTVDGAGQSLEFATAPYGDPAEPNGSALVEARYTRS